jgi:HAD superfamily hydrolase (TIGR01484 family)
MPLVDRLKQKGIDNIAVGEVIVATWQPHEHLVRDTLQEMDLSLEIILNKKAIMILPAGVNKASGMKIALEQLKISPEQTVGVGDAENDLDLLNFCGLGVAVDNALTIVKQQADWVTTRERGAGVRELIQKIIKENQFLDNN